MVSMLYHVSKSADVTVMGAEIIVKKAKTDNTKSPLKDTYLRRPGQSEDEEIARLQERFLLYLIILGLFAMVELVVWISYYYKAVPNPIIVTGLFLIVLIYCMFKISQMRKQLKQLVLGRDGEREVAEYLDNLTRRGCYVFHDIRGPNFNIDHVIISTYGIFAIETKAYSKPATGETSISFDGQAVKLINKSLDSGPVQQALNNALWLRNEIRENIVGRLFDVTGIVVFPGWFIPKEQMKGKGIWVMNEKWLESSITQLEPVLTPAEVQTVVNVVRPLTRVARKPLSY